MGRPETRIHPVPFVLLVPRVPSLPRAGYFGNHAVAEGLGSQRRCGKISVIAIGNGGKVISRFFFFFFFVFYLVQLVLLNQRRCHLTHSSEAQGIGSSTERARYRRRSAQLVSGFDLLYTLQRKRPLPQQLLFHSQCFAN